MKKTHPRKTVRFLFVAVFAEESSYEKPLGSIFR